MSSLRSKIQLGLLALASTLALAGKAQAQIIWSLPHTITGDSDVSTLGTYVDALQLGPGKSSAQIVNGVNFKAAVASNDGTISFSTISQSFTASLAPAGASPAYDAILHGTGGLNGQTGGVNNVATFTLSGLTLGSVYQLQVWSIGYPTTYSSPGGASVNLSSSFDIGTFTATAATQKFTITATGNNSYGTITDISLRDVTSVPEPSAYAMMITGLGLLVFALRFAKSRAAVRA